MCLISVSIKNNGNFHGSETIFDVKTEGQSQQDRTGYLISCIYSGQLSAHSPRTHTHTIMTPLRHYSQLY